MSREPSKKIKDRVLEVVKQIPSGKVVTYGMVGDHVGLIARTVGWIMASLNDEEMESVPWHRVIGSGGTIPAIKYGFRGQVQIDRLVEEGFEEKNNKIIVGDKYYQW